MDSSIPSPQSSITMHRILLTVLYLSGWHGCICLRQYHYVGEAKTWTEAQTYCRETYADLATVENAEEMKRLINTVSSAGHNTEFWFGLHTVIDWRWSDGFNGSGAEYRNWDTGSSEPDFYTDQFCVGLYINGGWYDIECHILRPFICFRGTQNDPEFVFVKRNVTWYDAQRLCRENFTDLATVRNITENQKAQKFVEGEAPWIGLFRDPNFYWSDGSSFSFSDWDSLGNLIGSRTVMCGSTSFARSGKWRFLPCERRFPFVCSVPEQVTKVVNLRVKVENPVALNDTAVKGDILKKLQDRLKEAGVTVVKLKWREQPDGKVFHREKRRKKSEL